MTTILLILTWALSLYVAGTICLAKGYKKGYADGSTEKRGENTAKKG